MPLFALANAGVSLGDSRLAGRAGRVFVGVALGLVLGKPIGVIGFSLDRGAAARGAIARRNVLVRACWCWA